MKKVACVYSVKAKGTDKPSVLYKELIALTNNRPMANLIYGHYRVDGVADRMNAEGFFTDKNNEHNARDVYEFLGGRELAAAAAISNDITARNAGFIDSAGNKVVFTNSEDAYNKAKEFNDNNKGKVAIVSETSTGFIIDVVNKDSATIEDSARLTRNMEVWDALKDEMRKVGVDISALTAEFKEIINPGKVRDFFQYVHALRWAPNDSLSERDISFMLRASDTTRVKELFRRYPTSTFDEIVGRVYSIAQNPSTVSSSTSSYITQMLNDAKFDLVDKIADSETVVEQVRRNNYATNEESKTVDSLLKLQQKYQIDNDIIDRTSRKANKISEVIADAISSVDLQLRKLEEMGKSTSTTAGIRDMKDTLMKELREKQYAGGLANFLKEGLRYINIAKTAIGNIPSTGTNLERAFAAADALTTARNMVNNYEELAKTIQAMDKLVADIAITDSQKNELINIAKEVNDQIIKLRRDVDTGEEACMTDLGVEFLGSTNVLHGMALSNIIQMMEADSSKFDYLYSIGRVSNPMLAVVGAIVRDAQVERDKIRLKFDYELRRANDILRKNHIDSRKFVDEDGMLLNPYDWKEYYKEKQKYALELITKDGLRKDSLEFAVEMQLWEDLNTEPVEVDPVTHRMERMPVYKKTTNPLSNLTAPEREYYNRITKIKAQLDSYAPAWAQHLYNYPQKRNSWGQAIKEYIKGGLTAKEVTARMLDDFRLLKMKQGTNKFRSNASVAFNGEEFVAATSDYDFTTMRKVPLFYMSKLDRQDLSLDVTANMLAYADTAINYYMMDSIKNLVETMSDYILNKDVAEKDKEGRAKADIVVDNVKDKNAITRLAGVIRRLFKRKELTTTSDLVRSFADKHLYGMEHRNETWLNTLCANLIGYTSIKGLSTNTLGALANKHVGVLQSIIMATRGQYFTIKDVLKAEAYLFGRNQFVGVGTLAGGLVGGVPGAIAGFALGHVPGFIGTLSGRGKIMEILTNNRLNKDTLIYEFFDVSQDMAERAANARFHSTLFGRIFGSISPMEMYQRGESWIHMLNAYAVLFHEKVYQYDPTTGKRKMISLYNALGTTDIIDGNRNLKLKDNIFTLNGEKVDNLNHPYFDAIRRRIRYANQNCHGSMNREDKGLIHREILGKLVMNFRQWMVEHYSRRYRGLHWDESIRDVNYSNFYRKTMVKLNGKRVALINALEMVDNPVGDGSFNYVIKDGATLLNGKELNEEALDNLLSKYMEDTGWRRGYMIGAIKVVKDFIQWRKNYGKSAVMFWDTLSETQKGDVKETLGAATVFASLLCLKLAAGDPDKYRGEFFKRVWLYNLNRLYFDELAATPWGMISEGMTLINNPIAAVNTLKGFIYPIVGILDANDTIKSGRYKGWNKYGRNILKFTVPFYWQIDRLLHIDDEEYAFSIFTQSMR